MWELMGLKGGYESLWECVGVNGVDERIWKLVGVCGNDRVDGRVWKLMTRCGSCLEFVGVAWGVYKCVDVHGSVWELVGIPVEACGSYGIP